MWECDDVTDCVVPEISNDDIINFKLKHSNQLFLGLLGPKGEGVMILSNVWNCAHDSVTSRKKIITVIFSVYTDFSLSLSATFLVD